MTMKTKLLLSLLALTLLPLTSCNNNKNNNDDDPIIIVDDEECDYTYDWVYDPENVDPYDTYMTIDGRLNEPIWDNTKWLTHKENKYNITVSYSTYFTEKGLYIAAIAEDSHIQWNSRLYYFNNSSFWFGITDVDCTYLRPTEFMNIFVDPYYAVSRNLNRFAGKAITDKAIGNGASKMTCEVFISWDSLNIEVPEGQDYPDVIRINPHYRYVESVGNTNNRWVRPLFYFDDRGRQSCIGRFGPDGYINADKENAILGDAGNGLSKSDGWDLSNIDLGVVTSDGPHSQAIFFKGINSERYVFETKMKIVGGIQDTWPSAGICNATDEIHFDTLHITGNDVLTNNGSFAIHHLSLNKNDVEGWVDKTIGSAANPGYDIITLKCIKDGINFYYIVNGVYIGSETISHLEGNACPGLYTLGCEAIFFDYKVKDYHNDAEGIENEILKHACPIKTNFDAKYGYVSASPSAVTPGNGVTLTISPNSGYIVEDITITDKANDIISIGGEKVNLDYYLKNSFDGLLYIPEVTNLLNVNITFSKFSGSTTRIITSIINEANGEPIANADFAFKGSDPRLYYSGTTGSSGGINILLPRAGTYEVGNSTITVDGHYDLYITRDNYPIYVGSVEVPSDSSKTMQLDAFSAPDLKMNNNIDKEFRDGGYVYLSKANVFKYSSYEYTSGTYANTAVYSVEISSSSTPSSQGYPGWAYNMGVRFTQGETLDPSITGIVETFNNNNVRTWTNNGNEYYSAQIGITQTSGILCSLGPVYYIKSTSKCDASLGGANPHTRKVTIVLKNNVIYTYLDNVYVCENKLTDFKYSFADQANNTYEYNFVNNKPLMFGVNFTNTDTPGVEAKVVDEYYDNDALTYLSENSEIYGKVA